MTSTTANTAFQRSAQHPLGRADQEVLSLRFPPTPMLIAQSSLGLLKHGDEVDRLQELMRLPYGWDGYRGRPTDAKTAIFALDVINAIAQHGALKPYIVPGSSGDLQIEYAKGDWIIELHVRGVNEVSAWHYGPDTDDDGEEVELRNDFRVVGTWLDAIVRAGFGDQHQAAG